MKIDFKLFNNVEIYPFYELLDNPRGKSFHRGGPLWEDWEGCQCFRHRRSGLAIDHKPFPYAGKFHVTNKKLAWCGPVCDHYGHQVADFSSRILPYKFLDDIYYCFANRFSDGFTSLDGAPVFFKAILEWFGVPKSRVVIINSPVIVEELVCVPQMEEVGVGPKDEYLELLTQNERTAEINPRPIGKKYYISRAGMSARFAGEAYIEYLFTRAGFKVVRPECLSLKEQLDIYRSASVLVFSEGSALHTLQLLGRVDADVHVFERRSGANLAKKLLAPRCGVLIYHDIGDLVYGLNLSGNPAPELGINVPNVGKLSEALRKLGIEFDVSLSNNVLDGLIDVELSAWMAKECSSKRSSEESLKLIRSILSNIER
ncbi:MAG: hypothetical protein CALGDGBN_00474 [Pseudomonadales bacterium]|nr:hypothetical protein [Pseudomonadales bacterium]